MHGPARRAPRAPRSNERQRCSTLLQLARATVPPSPGACHAPKYGTGVVRGDGSLDTWHRAPAESRRRIHCEDRTALCCATLRWSLRPRVIRSSVTHCVTPCDQVYIVMVLCGEQQWQVQRRYSEFSELQAVASPRPPPPPFAFELYSSCHITVC